MRSRMLLLAAFLMVWALIDSSQAQWTKEGVSFPAMVGGIVFNYEVVMINDWAGGAIIAWEEDDAGYVQRIDRQGRIRWSLDGIRVFAEGGMSDMVGDGRAGAIILNTDQSGISAQRVSDMGELEGGPLNLASPSYQVNYPLRGIGDGSGGVIVAWVNRPSGSDPGRVYVQRMDSKGNVQWKADGVVVASEEKDWNVQAISDGSGGVIVAYYHPVISSGDLHAQRVDSDGSLRWGENGLMLPAIGAMVSDDAGGAIFSWREDGVFYVQRIDTEGNRKWGETGVAAGTGTRNPYLVRDGEGGCVVAWRRGGDWPDHYAQRVGADGTLMWGGEALLFARASDPAPLTMVEDGTGGAIVVLSNAYEGERGWPGADIAVQRVDGDGMVRWNPPDPDRGLGGTVITGTADGRAVPKIVSDGSGGAIISWPSSVIEQTVPKTKICFQYINAEGEFGVTTSVGSPRGALELPKEFYLGQNYPNPFNPTTHIFYSVPEKDRCIPYSLGIYSATGQKVKTLVKEGRRPGAYTALWDGKDDMGKQLANGLYFCALSSRDFIEVRKMVMVR